MLGRCVMNQVFRVVGVARRRKLRCSSKLWRNLGGNIIRKDSGKEGGQVEGGSLEGKGSYMNGCDESRRGQQSTPV